MPPPGTRWHQRAGTRMVTSLPGHIPAMRSQVFWWAWFAAWVLFLTGYAIFKVPVGGLDAEGSDKVVHFLYYAGGSFCVAIALGLRSGSLGTRHVVWCTVLFTALGALDEFQQSFSPHRKGNDPGDLTADFLGGLVGALLAVWYFRRAFASGQRTGGTAPDEATTT